MKGCFWVGMGLVDRRLAKVAAEPWVRNGKRQHDLER